MRPGNDMAMHGGSSGEASRTIGLPGALAIGVGGMVGGGIFAVLGTAVSLAHGATAVAFLVAGAVALLTARSYARLSVAHPTRGGTVAYIDAAFGLNVLSGSLNVVLWLSYLVTLALYAVAFGSYASTLFPDGAPSWAQHAAISAAIVVPAILNLVSAALVSRSETAIVVFKLVLLLVVVVSGSRFVDGERLAVASWGSVPSIVLAGLVVFVAYEGFELIGNAAEEIVDPQRNLPRSIYGSVAVVIALYLMIAVITVGTVPGDQLLEAKDYALAAAARPALGQLGFTLVTAAALLATFSAINATVYGNARLGYLLARDGELPELLAKEERSVPGWGVGIIAGLSLVIANAVEVEAIATVASAGFLLVFTVVNLSAWRLRDSLGGIAPLSLIASVASGSALVALLANTWSRERVAIALFGAILAASLAFETIYGRWVRGHFLGRRYDGAAGSP